MKKIIKNLMLVAVAAMAFVACSQEGNEVNILAKKTTYEFVASFDAETRSQFVEDTDGDKVFQSVWNGGEEVLLFADAGSSVYANGTATMVLPEGGDGTTATFTGEFNGTVPPAGIIKAYVPASAWNVWSEAITIPATQTPTDHSVDSAAHILFGQTDYTDNTAIDGSDIMFSHAVAYGKMTIADTFESIDEVTITIDETEKYTINTNELTSSTIWFACYANENVNNLEVLVKSGDKTYVRTYELADGKLAFKTGRVSIFSVSNFEEYVAPAAPDYEVTFTAVEYLGEAEDYYTTYSQFKFTNEAGNWMILAMHPADVVDGLLPVGEFPINWTDQGEVYGNATMISKELFTSMTYDPYIISGNVVISKDGDVYTVVVNGKSLYLDGQSGKTLKATFEGTMTAAGGDDSGNEGGEEGGTTDAEDSLTYLGRYYELDNDDSTSGGGYMFKAVAGGVEYTIEMYWAYANAEGAIKVGTYNYCYNQADVMYSGWDGFSIISDSYYYGSTLAVTADGVATLTLKDANGDLIGEYTYENVAVFE